MLTKQEMLEIPKLHIKRMDEMDYIDTIILESQTIHKSYGSIFCYDSKLFQETGNFQYAIAGNAPFLVEKNTGKIVTFGTANNIDYYIKMYENNSL